MSSSLIWGLINTIRDTCSKTAKVAVLAECLEDEDFRRVITMALDARITYGLLQFPKINSAGSSDFSETTYWLLDQLAKRKVVGNSYDGKIIIVEHLLDLNWESQELFKNIVRKTFHAGFTAKSVNKARPGTIQEYPYMRCSTMKEMPLEKLDWVPGVWSEEKADGMFLNFNTNEGGYSAHTRQGMPFPADLLQIRAGLPPNLQFHGEVLVYLDGKRLPRKTGNGILNHILEGGVLESKYELMYLVWDVIPQHCSVSNLTYDQRWTSVQAAVEAGGPRMGLIPNRMVYSKEEALEHFQEILGAGGEGTVIKVRSGGWKDHTSRNQIKIKAEKHCELRVMEFKEGKDKYENTLGSMLCMSEDEELGVWVSGFTDAERDLIWQDKERFRGLVVTVKFNEVASRKGGGNYSLFLPGIGGRIEEFRKDKTVADTTIYIMGL